MEVWIGQTTFPSEEVAREISTKLVEENLAACVQLIPNGISIYQWQGKIETSQEVLAVLKFASVKAESLRIRLLELHPYEVPEWVAWPIAGGSPEYLAWVLSAATSDSA